MASLNKVILIGNLTADPELKYTSLGIPVCRFTLAVNRHSVKNENQQSADFITVVAWRQSAEFLSKYFKKGRPVLVVGQMQSRTWTDKNSVKQYVTEVLAGELSFVESRGNSGAVKKENDTEYIPETYASTNEGAAVPSDDTLPF